MIIQRCVIAFSDALSPFKWAHILIQTPDLFEAERELRCVLASSSAALERKPIHDTPSTRVTGIKH